jgi:hypothetical protein
MKKEGRKRKTRLCMYVHKEGYFFFFFPNWLRKFRLPFSFVCFIFRAAQGKEEGGGTPCSSRRSYFVRSFDWQEQLRWINAESKLSVKRVDKSRDGISLELETLFFISVITFSFWVYVWCVVLGEIWWANEGQMEVFRFLLVEFAVIRDNGRFWSCTIPF